MALKSLFLSPRFCLPFLIVCHDKMLLMVTRFVPSFYFLLLWINFIHICKCRCVYMSKIFHYIQLKAFFYRTTYRKMSLRPYRSLKHVSWDMTRVSLTALGSVNSRRMQDAIVQTVCQSFWVFICWYVFQMTTHTSYRLLWATHVCYQAKNCNKVDETIVG